MFKSVFESQSGHVSLSATTSVPVHNSGMGTAPYITMPDGKTITGTVLPLGTVFDVPRTPKTDLFGNPTNF